MTSLTKTKHINFGGEWLKANFLLKRRQFYWLYVVMQALTRIVNDTVTAQADQIHMGGWISFIMRMVGAKTKFDNCTQLL